jgi:hypothetical protein
VPAQEGGQAPARTADPLLSLAPTIPHGLRLVEPLTTTVSEWHRPGFALLLVVLVLVERRSCREIAVKSVVAGLDI